MAPKIVWPSMNTMISYPYDAESIIISNTNGTYIKTRIYRISDETLLYDMGTLPSGGYAHITCKNTSFCCYSKGDGTLNCNGGGTLLFQVFLPLTGCLFRGYDVL